MTGKSGSRRTAAALIIVGLMTLSAFVPAAWASHRTLYSNGPAGATAAEMRITYEDDAESTEAFTAGTVIGNCIVDADGVGTEDLLDNIPDGCETGTAPGTGGTFLDSYIYAQAAPAGVTTYYPLMQVYRTASGDPNNYIIGNYAFMAWFGFWDDKNADGRVDDNCKWENNEDPAKAAADEFVWRGGASGENGGSWDRQVYNKARILVWVYPNNYSGLFDFGERMNWPGPDFDLADRTMEDEGTHDTAKCPFNTGWMSFGGGSAQSGDNLLHETVMLTAVNAEPRPSEPRGWAPEQAAYTDVDYYAAIHPSANELYFGLSIATEDALNDAVNTTQPIVEEVVATAEAVLLSACGATVGMSCDEFVNQTAQEVCGAATGDPECAVEPPPLPSTDYGKLQHAITPVMPHEPNTPFDVYPGASYGGTSYAAGTGCGADTPTNPMGQCNDYVKLVDHDNDPLTPDIPTGYAGGWHAWVDNWAYPITEVFRRAYATPGFVSGVPVGGGIALCNPSFTCWGNLYGQAPGSHGAYNDHALGPGEWAFYELSPSGDVSMGGIAGLDATTGTWFDVNGDTWIGDVASTLADANSGNPVDYLLRPPPFQDNFLPTIGNAEAPNNQYADGEIMDPNNYDDSYSATNVDGEFRGVCGANAIVNALTLSTVIEPLTPDGLWPPESPLIIFRDFNEPGRYSGEGKGSDFEVILQGPGVIRQGCVGPEDSVLFLAGNFAPFDVKVTTTFVIRVDDPTTPDIETTEETVTDVDIYTRFGGS